MGRLGCVIPDEAERRSGIQSDCGPMWNRCYTNKPRLSRGGTLLLAEARLLERRDFPGDPVHDHRPDRQS
jgi:hypothetical protein